MKNPSTQKKYCVLIICPHPDDGEIFAPQICIQAIKAGYEVHQLLSCCDEYGSSIDEFKGKRIQRIRKHEMICASKAYGVDQDGNAILKLHWANYIDGFVPFDKKSIDRYKKFILKIKPDIILGPDPFIHCDGHRDHIATGKNYYYALKSINTKNRPKLMLFFQTIMPDFFIKEQDRDIVKKVRLAHKSQMPPLIFNTFIPNLAKYFLYPTALMRHSSGKNAVGYRRVTFDKKSHVPKGYAKFLFNNFFNDWGFGDGIDSLFIPRPHELGLTLEPKGDIK